MLRYCTMLVVVTTVLAANFALAGQQAEGMIREMIVDDFADGLSKNWQPKYFKGVTQYTATNEDGRPCIKAESDGTASGLYNEFRYDSRQFPLLKWEWRVDNVISKGNAYAKEGDDYAARIYVAFPAFFFWNTKVLNYIWANTLPKNAATLNPYSDNFMMIAVESGLAMTGQWVTEERNIYEDYKKYFGEEPPDVGVIGIMTDTDDTGEQASACYGKIIILNKSTSYNRSP